MVHEVGPAEALATYRDPRVLLEILSCAGGREASLCESRWCLNCGTAVCPGARSEGYCREFTLAAETAEGAEALIISALLSGDQT